MCLDNQEWEIELLNDNSLGNRFNRFKEIVLKSILFSLRPNLFKNSSHRNIDIAIEIRINDEFVAN